MATRGKARFAVAILAAGKGTRLKSKHPKVLHPVGGKPLVAHVIDAARRVVPARDIHVIIGHEAERVREAVEATGVRFVLQQPQRGTGHALMVARRALAAYTHVLVLSGDVPRVRPETIARLRDFHLAQGAAMTILTAEPPDPAAYGRVIRSYGDEVSAIVEARALTPEQQNAREINSGIYAFAVAPLFRHIGRLSTANYHRELYLTDMAAILAAAGERVVALRVESSEEVLGANTRAELVELDALLRREKCARLMESGVTIFQPETCVIDAEVEIAPDTVIEPFVQILGKTRIGSDCRIRSYSVISDCEIESGVTIRPGCILDQSRVRRGAILGPYSHLRPGTDVGEGAHVGNFVETKKARLGRGAKANHLTYLGDAEIGAGVNVGAGTITCNYDGARKHVTVIEDRAFIGSDTTLVAPVRVGRGAYIGAGSSITEDVPAGALAIARGRQVNKPGWVRRNKAKAAKKISHR
ncbi:MAG TPA: bifunctional UDP-N-acetylglucosamine diphosphorylase/glucosamine-1-phosphate N-acetyltransferase GlmU [Terriglobales bacterium]|nr:bifunctional UDP-N-acetylglucosamine diphosphorylase/glucosamine-1-phosphate N-acetyltransferase GlmU [Terriglobales bacterium]